MEKLIKIGLAVLFLVCLADLPYGYYQFVRFAGMVGFGILAYQAYENENKIYILWVCSAILIQPLIKISLGRTLWNIVDVIWAVLLIGSMLIKPKEKD